MESDLHVPESTHDNSLSLAVDMKEDTNDTRDDTIESEVEAQSFNISTSFIRPMELEDVPVEEQQPTTTYELLGGATLMGGRMLLDNIWFGFTQKCCRGNVTYWWCSPRSKTRRCPATVIERLDTYTPGRHNYNHPADPGMKHRVKIAKVVKSEAKKNIFTSGRRLVEIAFEENSTPTDFNLPDQDLLTRRANRARQKLRPADPRGEHFENSP